MSSQESQEDQHDLYQAIGKCVRVCVANQLRDVVGLLWSIDPETRQVIVFTLPQDATLNVDVEVRAAVITESTITEWSLAPEHHVQQWETVLGLANSQVGDGEQQLSLNQIQQKLDTLRIPYAVEEESKDVVILDGVARIVPPYRELDCQSSNEMMLERLVSELWTQPQHSKPVNHSAVENTTVSSVTESQDKFVNEAIVTESTSTTDGTQNDNLILVGGIQKQDLLLRVTIANLTVYSQYGPKVANVRRRAQIPPPEGVDRKYWNQRHRLFSRYDEGIVMDKELWYSVTPESIAEHIAERCRCTFILDAFAGAGGNAIQFAYTCERVVAIDIDHSKLECVKQNAAIYSVEDRVELIQGDAVTIMGQFAFTSKNMFDIVFLSPPWGGPQYQNAEIVKLEDIVVACPTSGKTTNGLELLDIAKKLSPNVVYFLPRNIDPLSCQAAGALELEQHVIKNKIKTVCAYFGDMFAN